MKFTVCFRGTKLVLVSPDAHTHKISGTGQRKPSNNAP